MPRFMRTKATETRYLFILPQEPNAVTLPRKLVFDRTLSQQAKLTYAMAVALCANPKWKLNHAGLATVLGSSLRSVKTWTKELQTAGWLSIEKVHAPQNRMVIGYDWKLRKDPKQDNEALVRRSDTIIRLVKIARSAKSCTLGSAS